MANLVARASLGERETIYRFLVLRMIVATFIVGTGMMIIQVTNESFPVRPLYLLLAVSALTGGATYVGFRFGLGHRVGLWILLISDILLGAVIIHFSGGVASQFSLIYCLTILAAAFLLEMPGGLSTAILASTCYISYGILETVNVLAPPNQDLLAATPRPLTVLQVYMHVLVYFVVGTVGGYLARRIKLKGRQLASTETELERLKIDTDYIINNMSSGILVIDTDGVIVTMNPAAEEILDVPMNEVLNRDLDEALNNKVPQLTSELRQALLEEKSKFRHEILIRDGQLDETPLGTSISILRDANGEKRGVISVFQDLTEVQAMRKQIRKADRLAAIGELSAGIAHELRNPLASISGSIEVLANELELAGENERLMNLITRESERLNRIISDFLEFAGLRPPRKRTMSIGTCLDEVMTLLRNNPAKSEDVEIELEQHATEVYLEVDDEQLRQVFLNLAVNSCEAMENGGSLQIVTEQEQHGWLKISFCDEGPGIDDENVNRLFEPFFTTKERGTGLGLAIANRIIVAHGGTIEFKNRKQGGAEFNIILPIGSGPVTNRARVEVTSAV